MPDKYIKHNHPAVLQSKEIDEINAYWGKFGVRLNDYSWHQMYYSITGIHDPRFIPHNFADSVIYPYLNNRERAVAWVDKNYFARFLPMIRFPEVLGQKINKRYYDSDHQCYAAQDYRKFCDHVFRDLGNDTSFIIKKTSDTSQGKGVRRIDAKEISDVISIVDAYGELDDFIIQRVVKQHAFFEQFNKSSVNIVRITTIRIGSEIHAIAPCIRFGIEGSSTDVAYVDGEEIINAIGVNDDGTVSDYSITLAGQKNPFNGEIRTVPKWNDMLNICKQGHEYLEQFDIVAWDMTVDEDENVICIEYNLNSPGSIVYQMAHGPFFGEDTERVLDFLKDDINRKRYLPASAFCAAERTPVRLPADTRRRQRTAL